MPTTTISDKTDHIPCALVLKVSKLLTLKLMGELDVKLKDGLEIKQLTSLGTDLERRGGGCRIRWMQTKVLKALFHRIV